MSGVMRLVRSEILRARSGSSFPLLLSYAVIVPGFTLGQTGILHSLASLDDGAATRLVFACVACAALGACFYGSYAYTRETYYHSLERTLLLGNRDAILIGKSVAGAASGAIFGVVAILCWTPITIAVLAASGHGLVVDATVAVAAVGTILSCALSGVIGVAVGYVIRNYYLGIPVILILPPLIAVPMLTHLREIERFLPAGALAGSTVAPLDGLLPAPLALLVLLAWSILSVAGARAVERRRRR
ncbi:hypothetical protein B0H03_107136 [Rathayibacter iranicus NCPPB 2253 = VKM Ac-1602]|nr:hypothetical protein B0H03_107136 [Rathayibacter iranicus NCPPB 2253 = VKM Ac-1602]